jgi:RES domain-containing protein
VHPFEKGRRMTENSNKASPPIFTLHDWSGFKEYITHKNRFILDKKQKEFVVLVRNVATKKTHPIERGEEWFRCRKKTVSAESKGKGVGCLRCEKSDVIAPPPDSASEGRSNPRGMPVLYLSKSQHTAVVEARPSLNEMVTVATFNIDKDISVVDLRAAPQTMDEYQALLEKERKESITQSEVEEHIWGEIGRAFSRPTSASDQEGNYIPTQYLAGVFKAEGFGGVLYSSALHKDGENLALFDAVGAAQPQRGSVDLVELIEFSLFGPSKTEEYK